VHAVVGFLGDDVDPLVTVMKLEKAPQESYADIGGLDTQITEIKVRLLLCCTRVDCYVVRLDFIYERRLFSVTLRQLE